VTAVKEGHVVLGDNNAMTRPGPRLVEAAQFLLNLVTDAAEEEVTPAA